LPTSNAASEQDSVRPVPARYDATVRIGCVAQTVTQEVAGQHRDDDEQDSA
jgi:hypothetical protein